jgi:hypothetical protein
MLQLIARQAIADPALRHGRLADPDLLLEIAEQARRQGTASFDSDLSRLFSHVLHDLRMGGAWKRTNEGRLARTQEMLRQHIAPQYRDGVTLLDLGASDGITTAEAVRALRLAWQGEVTAYLTDLNLWLYRYRNGLLVEYRAQDGEPIMARIGPLGLRLAKQRHDIDGGQDRLSAFYLGCRRLREAMRQDARISLVNPVAAAEPGLTAMELNCLQHQDELVGKFTAVRASNVLNLGYFSPAQVAQAVGHLHAYLRDEGCLVISRNADHACGEVENGSVWLKRAERMEWVEDFGSGSEVKAAVDAWRRTGS